MLFYYKPENIFWIVLWNVPKVPMDTLQYWTVKTTMKTSQHFHVEF